MKIRICIVAFMLCAFFLMGHAGVAEAQSPSTFSLNVTSPKDGALLFQSPVLVEGTIEGATSGIASVTCNGDPAIVGGETFS